MKKLILTALIFMFCVSWFGIFYYNNIANAGSTWSVTESSPAAQKGQACPSSKMSQDCMDCHIMTTENGKPKFGLKEVPLKNNYSAKPHYLDIIQEVEDGPPVAVFEVNGTNSSKFRGTADYLLWHPEIKKVIVDLFTGGGSVMDAWQAVGIVKEMQSNGVHVEMRVYGLSASAGVILMVAGDSRLVNPHAQIMIHKLWTFTMFDIKTPDTSQDTADVMKHFQDNINKFLRDRTNLTEAQLDDKIFKKNWWMTGAEAIELGIATDSL